MGTPWSHRYAYRTAIVKSSTIRELLKLTQRPEVISFAGGLPAPDVFPVSRFPGSRRLARKCSKKKEPPRSSTAPPRAFFRCGR